MNFLKNSRALRVFTLAFIAVLGLVVSSNSYAMQARTTDQDERTEVEKTLGVSHGASPYEILGVTPNASQKQINDAYSRLMREWDPNNAKTSEEWTLYTQIRNAITFAYNEI